MSGFSLEMVRGYIRRVSREITITDVGMTDTSPQYQVRRGRVDLIPATTSDLELAKQIAGEKKLPTERVVLVDREGFREDVSREFPTSSPRRPERARARDERRSRHRR